MFMLLLLSLCGSALSQGVPQAVQDWEPQTENLRWDRYKFDLVPAPTPNPPPVGVALPDIVWRALDENGKADPVGLSSSLATISSICSATPAGSVFLARFPVLPFYPDAVGAILSNGTEYWPTLDAIMQAFTSSGCFTLVPIIFYNPYALVDAFREPMGLFASAARNKTMVGGKLAGGVSNAWDASLAYLRALIPRYSTWTSIRAWELSNDWNLQFDMDAGSGCYACEPLRGTPAARSRWDNISTYDGVKVQQAWAGYIRALDGALSRPISSGHAMPRPATARNCPTPGMHAWLQSNTTGQASRAAPLPRRPACGHTCAPPTLPHQRGPG